MAVEDLLEVVAAHDLRPEGAVLVGELGHLGQADLVDLLGRLVGRGEVAQGRGVHLVAAVEPRQAAAVVGPGVGQRLLESGAELGEPRAHRPLDGVAQLTAQLGRVDAVGHPHRRHRGVVLDGHGERPVELLEGLAHGELGRDPAVLRRAPHPVGQLIGGVRRPPSSLAGSCPATAASGTDSRPEDQRQLDLEAADRVGRQAGERRVGHVCGGRRGGDRRPRGSARPPRRARSGRWPPRGGRRRAAPRHAPARPRR